MSVKITTDDKGIKVFRKDKTWSGGTFATYSCKISSKDKNDEWQSVWKDLKFKKGVELNDKAVIQINNAFPVVESYKDTKKESWMVLDFDVIENGEVAAQVDADGFSAFPSDIDDDLPFAMPTR